VQQLNELCNTYQCALREQTNQQEGTSKSHSTEALHLSVNRMLRLSTRTMRNENAKLTLNHTRTKVISQISLTSDLYAYYVLFPKSVDMVLRVLAEGNDELIQLHQKLRASAEKRALSPTLRHPFRQNARDRYTLFRLQSRV